jgi:hypothetical protein
MGSLVLKCSQMFNISQFKPEFSKNTAFLLKIKLKGRKKALNANFLIFSQSLGFLFARLIY